MSASLSAVAHPQNSATPPSTLEKYGNLKTSRGADGAAAATASAVYARAGSSSSSGNDQWCGTTDNKTTAAPGGAKVRVIAGPNALAAAADEQGERRRSREAKFGSHLGSEAAADMVRGVIVAPLGTVSSDGVKAGVQGDIRLQPSEQVCVRLGGTGQHSKQ